ncbi:MAG TPA: hypothetical protein VIV61_00665 [Candidatus Ozemobacteraceae bacterium]
MSRYRPWLITGLFLGTFTLTVLGQSGAPSARGASPAPSGPGRTLPLNRGAGQTGPASGGAATDARTFLTQAQSLLAEGRAAEAKEAVRTALRLEPMNIEAWNLYDRAVEAEYVARSREERISPVVDRDLKPVFAINKVDSYTEFNTLYLVGELRNVSDALRRRVELVGLLLDENGQELRRETGSLRLQDRGLFPSESALFEIEIPSPPPGVKSFRVKVLKYE